jgi:hypothetical protein
MKRGSFSLLLLFALLLLGITGAFASDDLKVVLLDSKDAHVLRGKLVCVWYTTGDPRSGVTERSRDCHRTDSTGTVGFVLPEGDLARIHVVLATDGLLPCYATEDVNLTEALKTGSVATNTCGDAETETTAPGELVLFAHQTSLWEAAKSKRNEF